MGTEVRKKLGEALVQAKILTAAQLKIAEAEAEQKDLPTFIIALLELGLLTYKTYEKFLSATRGVKTAIVAGQPPARAISDKLGAPFIAQKYVFPIATREEVHGKNLALGMVDPLD